MYEYSQRCITFILKILSFFISYIVLLCNSYSKSQIRKRTKKMYKNQMKFATQASEWVTVASNLDILEGYDNWSIRLEKSNNLKFNDQEIIQHIQIIESLLEKQSYKAIGIYLSLNCYRNAFSLNTSSLYIYLTKTKVIVERYFELFIAMIQFYVGMKSYSEIVHLTTNKSSSKGDIDAFYQKLIAYNDSGIEITKSQKKIIISRCIKSYGTSCLHLSGGGCLGMYHIGVCKALIDMNLLPSIISGSSGGAIIAGLICCNKIDEFFKKIDNDSFILDAFDGISDKKQDINIKLIRLLNTGGLMSLRQLSTCLHKNYGDLTFLEAFNYTGRIMNVSVTVDRAGENSFLLNYLTSPNILIWSAVTASCCLPGLFEKVELYQKNMNGDTVPYMKGQLWYDGSVTNDIPRKKLTEEFNCDFFIVSQVNPHVIPFKEYNFYSMHQKSNLVEKIWFKGVSQINYWITKIVSFAHNNFPRYFLLDIIHYMLNQNYSGDVSIYPIGSVWKAIPDYINIVTNPTKEYIEFTNNKAFVRTLKSTIQIKTLTQIENNLKLAYNFLT